MQCVTVQNETRATLIGDRIEVADTSLRRLVGLLGRDRISPGGGLWIRPSSGVHTVAMTFPIDVIGMDKHCRIVKLWPSLKPYRITSVSWSMQSVLELPAGQIALSSCQLGDRLQIVEVPQ